MNKRITALIMILTFITTLPIFAAENTVETWRAVVPVMTSNLGTNGYIPFASSEYSDRKVYRAFDGQSGHYTAVAWEANSPINEFLGVELPVPKVVNRVTVQDSTGYHPLDFDIQASQDKQNWTTLASKNISNWAADETLSIEFANNTAYKYYRLYARKSNAEAIVNEFQLYEYIAPAKTPQIKITAPDRVNSGQTFDIVVSAENMSNIYAEDFRFFSENSAFQIIKSEEISAKQDIYHNNSLADGFRVIMASQNEDTGIQTSEQLFRITLKALNAPSGLVSIKNALVANHMGIEIQPSMDEKTIIINHIDADVNADGRYSLGDLSMAAFNKSKDKTRWSTVKADVNKSDTVDEVDLGLIVEKILN